MRTSLLLAGLLLLVLPADVRAQQRPPAHEEMPATTPKPATTPEPAAAPEAPADIDGETMFATACGFCHQAGGRAPGKGPKLAGTARSDDFMAQRIRSGKPGAMPAFGRAFSESQIMAIVAYIRTLEDERP